MSSAQIVSASALHNNKTGLSGLGLPAPVSYPPPVMPPYPPSGGYSLLHQANGVFLFFFLYDDTCPVLATWSSTRTLSRVRFFFHFGFSLNFVVPDVYFFFFLGILCNLSRTVSSRLHNHTTQLAPVRLPTINRGTARRMVERALPGAAAAARWPFWRRPPHPTTTHLRPLRRHRRQRWPRRPVLPLQLHLRHGKDGPLPPTSCGWSSSRPSSNSNAIPIR